VTVHASEVAQIVKEALDADGQVGAAEMVAHTPNPDHYYKNRDGRYEYVVAGRDCVRGFRITVEAIPFEDVDRLAHPEQYGS